jgi:hypothetical protein
MPLPDFGEFAALTFRAGAKGDGALGTQSTAIGVFFVEDCARCIRPSILQKAYYFCATG